MKVRAIGDVHGKYSRYKKLIKSVDHSIALGDVGVGFYDPITSKAHTNPPFDTMVRNNAYFIRGNHDNPSVCKRHKRWIPDGTMHMNLIFCLGGATSVDWYHRTEHYDWWVDEELSYKELCDVVEFYEKVKPNVIFSHEVPNHIADYICRERRSPKLDIPSDTRRAFDIMFEIHKPQLIVHGHWHTSYRTKIDGVDVIGLDELEPVDLDL